MHVNYSFKIICRVIILFSWLPGAFAISANSLNLESIPDLTTQSAFQSIIYIADSDEKSGKNSKPKSGTLVLPSNYDKKEDSREKKCMTVCSRWGEDCVYNTRTGRRCRTVCKELTEECF